MQKKNAVSVANKSGLQIFEKVKFKIALELLAMSLCALCVQNVSTDAWKMVSYMYGNINNLKFQKHLEVMHFPNVKF